MNVSSLASRVIVLCGSVISLLGMSDGAQLPAAVTLENLVQTYSGLAKNPVATTQPPQLPVQIVYRNLSANAPAPVSEIVYNDSPDPLAGSYYSYGFEVQQLTALGKTVKLGGNARKLESCEAILVTWAKAADWPALAAANPAGYYHPITITLYEVTSTNEFIYRTESTKNVLIPWRPLTLPDGSTFPFNGYAFRANVPFTNGIILPERVMVMVSFNTKSYGFEPIKTAGPYDGLNVALKNNLNVTRVGSEVNPDVALQIRNQTWYYPSTGWTRSGAPMLRLQARSSESTAAPISTGKWQATARVDSPDYAATTTSKEFTIQAAPASIQLGRLTQVCDDQPKSVSVTTNPPGVPVKVTYNQLATEPCGIGKYAVHAEIVDPNYFGTADAELRLGQGLNSWLKRFPGVPGDCLGSRDDPDQDAIPNLMEYALALDPCATNPNLPNRGNPRLEHTNREVSLIFRKNAAAADLDYAVESSVQLGDQEVWTPAPTSNTVILSDGEVETVRASMEVSPGEPRRFLRLKVTRQDP